MSGLVSCSLRDIVNIVNVRSECCFANYCITGSFFSLPHSNQVVHGCYTKQGIFSNIN